MVIEDQSSSPQIALGQPVLVSEAPANEDRWGWYQFPSIERLRDGRLLIQYQLAADTHSTYGAPTGKAVSSDRGRTWQAVAETEGFHGFHFAWVAALELPNGDRPAAINLPSRKVNDLDLPPPAAIDSSTYCGERHWWRAEGLPAELTGWRFARLCAGSEEWVEESAQVKIPGEARTAWTYEGVLTLPWMDRMRLTPDGSVWGLTFLKRFVDGKLMEKCEVAVLGSADGGRSWDLRGEVPYEGDPEHEPDWEKHEGFTEPDIVFLPDGSALCLIGPRTVPASARSIRAARPTMDVPGAGRRCSMISVCGPSC